MPCVIASFSAMSDEFFKCDIKCLPIWSDYNIIDGRFFNVAYGTIL